jgi:hypothetical protein
MRPKLTPDLLRRVNVALRADKPESRRQARIRRKSEQRALRSKMPVPIKV